MTRLATLTLAGAALALSTAGAFAQETEAPPTAPADAAAATMPAADGTAAAVTVPDRTEDRLIAQSVAEAVLEGQALRAVGLEGTPIGHIVDVRIDDGGLGQYLIALDPALELAVERVTFRGAVEYDGDGAVILSMPQADFTGIVRDHFPSRG